MKARLTALLLALMLALPCAAGAETHTVEGLYSVEYEDGLTLDTTTYLLDRTDTYTWLFMLYGDEYTIDASMTKLEGYDGFSLYNATEEQRASYASDTLQALSDYDAELLSTMSVVYEGAEIPFYIFSCKDENGAYLMGETIAGGYALDFYCYYEDGARSADDALTQRLVSLLQSFTPV